MGLLRMVCGVRIIVVVIDTKKGEQILSVSPIEYIGREITVKESRGQPINGAF